MARPGQGAHRGPGRGAFWVEEKAAFLKMENEVRARPTPAGDSSWLVPALPRGESPPPGLPCHQPVVRPALPDAPCADSCPSGWPWLERGGGPHSMLDLIRPCSSPAAWTWAGPRHLPTPSLPWLIRACRSSWEPAAGTGKEDGGPRRQEGKSLARVPCGAARRPPARGDRAGHGLFLVLK